VAIERTNPLSSRSDQELWTHRRSTSLVSPCFDREPRGDPTVTTSVPRASPLRRAPAAPTLRNGRLCRACCSG